MQARSTVPLDRPGLGWASAGVAVLALLRNRFELIAAVPPGIGAVSSTGAARHDYREWTDLVGALAPQALPAPLAPPGRPARVAIRRGDIRPSRGGAAGVRDRDDSAAAGAQMLPGPVTNR